MATICQAKQEDVDRAMNSAARHKRLGRNGRTQKSEISLRHSSVGTETFTLFAVIETLDNGKPIRESRDRYSTGVRHFYFHVSLQLMEKEMPSIGHMESGQVVPWNFRYSSS